jgi:NhaC family Na+:H+ antiporter
MKSINKDENQISLFAALFPLLCLVALLAFNVFVFGDDAISGSNQFILLVGGAIASMIGFSYNRTFKSMLDQVGENLKSVSSAILILLLVGSLSASWLISGIVPAMIYYGILLINPVLFLPSAVIISAIISIATGSSWTTSATIGIALIAIGKAMGIPAGIVAGAVISGAYFGDKLSPLSDTTNLAAAMAGSNLFSHIRYMLYTTIPSIIITLIVFSVISFTLETGEFLNNKHLLLSIQDSFTISPWLFVVPLFVIVLIIKKVSPIIALFAGTILGLIFASFVQLIHLSMSPIEMYKYFMNSITTGVSIDTSHPSLNDLFVSGGMEGMLGTIWLIICAMVFGGIMESIGALSRISAALLSVGSSIFSLFASTVASCLTINLTASDQYLSIVVPGKMFSKAFEEKNLAPENLSRTLEDSGTVTSVLVPWNTCGAYQSSVLGVGVGEFFVYAVFNYVSPFMTLIFAALKMKIKQRL